MFYALEFLSQHKVIGRSRLPEHLYVGEGTVRTLLGRLIETGLVKISRSGCALTDKGLRVWWELEQVFPRRTEFYWTELTSSIFSYAFLIKGGGYKVRSGIEQRDAAIVAGALCAVVVVFKDGRLRIKSVCDDVEKTFPIVARQILGDLNPQEDDAIVIAGGDTPMRAMRGAFAASWSLLGGK